MIALWVVSGLACAYQVPANAAFVAAVPDAHRGQAFGLAVTALRVTQGLGVLLAGLLAERTGPATAVALAGALGVVVAAACVPSPGAAPARPDRPGGASGSLI